MPPLVIYEEEIMRSNEKLSMEIGTHKNSATLVYSKDIKLCGF